MVSPSSVTSQPPALSYADRAKKAQGLKPASQSPQKPLFNHPRQPPVSTTESAKSAKSPPTAESAQAALADLSIRNVPPSANANQSSHVTTAESSAGNANAQDIVNHGASSASSAPAIAPTLSASAKAPPVPNVWNQRIQQMAQARAQPPPQPHSSGAPSHAPPVIPPQQTQHPVASGSRQTDMPPPGGIHPVASSSGLNSISSVSTPSTASTHASRRELPSSPLPPPPPSIGDSESWPEVSRSQALANKPQHVTNGHVPITETKDDVGKRDGEGRSPGHPGTPRKSEKAKWIVIPPEELQAAADALNPSRSQSRSHSQFSVRHNQPRSGAQSGPGSVQGSQAPSKVASGRTSAAHSRAHSPSSLVSSPRHPGRGRQLPIDPRAAPALDQQRSSQGNSPRVYADTTLAAPVPCVQINRDIYSYGNMPGQSTGAQGYAPPPPPPHYAPAMPVNPNPAQQSYASASISPYPQPYTLHTPPDRYGPPPAQPLPPGWAAPEHYMYQYGYPPYVPPHPVMYWHGNMPMDARQDGRGMYPPYPPVHPQQQVAPPPHVPQDDGEVLGDEHVTQPSLPPPTMIIRPPPPQESDAVAGYREVGPVPDPSSISEVTLGRPTRDVIFGSIGAPGSTRSPSPAPPSSDAATVLATVQSGASKLEHVATTFSIGVAPGEAGPSHVRSRTRSQPRLSRAERPTEAKTLEQHPAAEVTVADLTASETRWEFGTATQPQDEDAQSEETKVDPQAQHSPPAALAPAKSTLDVSLLFSGPSQEASLPAVPPEPPLTDMPHTYPPHQHVHYILPQAIHVPPMPPPQEGLQLQTGPGPYPVHPAPAQPPSSASTDGFEVKDFGYGFGRASGTGIAAPTRDERIAREREWERNRDVERDTFVPRPRRGSYSGYHERGGYPGRRGRGANGFGRGLPGRGFARGGGFRHHQQPHQQQQPAPPFTVTPPAPNFQPLQPPSPQPAPPPDVSQYFGPVAQQPYGPHFGPYQAPAPIPYGPPGASATGPIPAHAMPGPPSMAFSLDATRHYLLGQLEYYLSAENMASDFFLRKKMDSRGWIPISLLASFPRVLQMTQGPHPQLVRDALALSGIVEVREDYVRMGGGRWEQYVLPGAPRSTVEPHLELPSEHGQGHEHEQDHDQADAEDAEGEDEDEEEEIEFVMDAGQAWVTAS